MKKNDKRFFVQGGEWSGLLRIAEKGVIARTAFSASRTSLKQTCANYCRHWMVGVIGLALI